MFRIVFLAALVMLAAPLSQASEAGTHTKPSPATITIDKAYAFATMPGATTGAAFMEIHNTGSQPDRLLGAQSDIAKITEIHENVIDPDDGTMMMRKINGLDIPAGGHVALKPKGYHVMFMKLTKPLSLNETVDLTLHFEKAGDIHVTANVVAPGRSPVQEKVMPWGNHADHAHQHEVDHMDHMNMTGEDTTE